MSEIETLITLVDTEVESSVQKVEQKDINLTVIEGKTFFENTDSVHLEIEMKEKDMLVEYTEADGSVFLAESTHWIFPLDFGLPLRSPNDTKFLNMQIYEDLGQISAVMRKMNWHPACKKEFMRWVRKLGLSDDIKIARDGIIDEAEEVVKEAVRANDVDSAKFVLKTAGKNRGWSEKEDSKSGGDVYAFINIGGETELDLGKLSDSDLTRILEDSLKN